MITGAVVMRMTDRCLADTLTETGEWYAVLGQQSVP
jgi:hypothetical protein